MQEQAPVRAGQTQFALDFADLHDIGFKVEGRPRDGELPDRPSRLCQEPGYVESEGLSRGPVALHPIRRTRRGFPDHRCPLPPSMPLRLLPRP